MYSMKKLLKEIILLFKYYRLINSETFHIIFTIEII